MVKKVALVLALLTITLGAETPLQVVTRVRKAHPDLPGNRTVTNQALKEIARDLGAGVLTKTSGNNCGGIACDIICYKTGYHYDVFRDWENVAAPTYSLVTNPPLIDPARCQLIAPGPTPPPGPTCEQEVARLKVEKEQLVSENLTLTNSLNQCNQDKAELQRKLDNVSCRGFWGLPCTVIK